MEFDQEPEAHEDLERVFREVGPRVARNLTRSTTQAVAKEIAKEIKSKAPKDEGVLRKSIKAVRKRMRYDVAEAWIIGVYYWWFIEHGTVDKPSRPFVKPVVDTFSERRMLNIFVVQFGNKLEAAIRRAWKHRRDR